MKQNLKQTARKRLAAMALFLLICLPFSLAQAQTIKVNGRVTDDLNEPMIGVSIFEKGTTNGVITDMDGNYSLSVKEGATIVYSYIGYLTQEKKAVAGVMNVILKEDTKTLDEVVVVGYGVQKKSSLTGAVSSVKSEDMEARTITRAEQALQGKTAGVQVLSASAKPGASPQVRIRGISSNGSCDPLYVVDGRIASDIGGIDPNDIESMEVLKDGASAAIYGAAAGNGVVLITTKKGKGNGKITYDFQYTSQSLGKVPEVMNAAQYSSSLSIPISRYNQLRRVAYLCAEGWDSSDAELVKVVCGELNVSAKVAGTLIKEYRTLLMQRMEEVLTPRELNLVQSYLGIGQPDEVGMTFQKLAIYLNYNGPSGAEKAYKAALRKLKKDLYGGAYGRWLSAQKAIRAAKAEAEADPGHYTTPQTTWLDEKELMERFICEVVSLIRVHEIFSDALENIAAKIFEES